MGGNISKFTVLYGDVAASISVLSSSCTKCEKLSVSGTKANIPTVAVNTQ